MALSDNGGGVFVPPPYKYIPSLSKCGQSPRGAAPKAHMHRPQHTVVCEGVTMVCAAFLTRPPPRIGLYTCICTCIVRGRVME